MRTIVLILILTLTGLQYKLWVGDDSIHAWRDLQQKIVVQTTENKKLEQRNHALEADIIELKTGEQALEEQARYELGMIKQEETYYQFVD